MKLIIILMAAFAGTSKANVAVDSSLDVVSDAPQAITVPDTKQTGLVSAVAAVITAAAPNLRGAGSFGDVDYDYDKGEQIAEEVQEDIATTGTDYKVQLYNYFPGVEHTGTGCRVTARIVFKNGKSYEVYTDDYIDGCAAMKFKPFIIQADELIGDFMYVELETSCDDALLVDMVTFGKSRLHGIETDGKIHWGKENDWGWCMSTDPNDAASDWEVMMGRCYRRFRFATNGHVYDPDGACDGNVPIGGPSNECCTIKGNCKFCSDLSAFVEFHATNLKPIFFASYQVESAKVIVIMIISVLEI